MARERGVPWRRARATSRPSASEKPPLWTRPVSGSSSASRFTSAWYSVSRSPPERYFSTTEPTRMWSPALGPRLADEGAVRGAEILDDVPVPRSPHARVPARDILGVEHEVAAGVAPEHHLPAEGQARPEQPPHGRVDHDQASRIGAVAGGRIFEPGEARLLGAHGCTQRRTGARWRQGPRCVMGRTAAHRDAGGRGRGGVKVEVEV